MIDSQDNSRGEKRALLIAYAFPPTGGSGVQRPAKFAKYLPTFGWLPTVWTADQADGLPRDESLCDDLPPEVTVCCQRAGGGVRTVRRSLRGFANARAGEGMTAAAARLAKAIDGRLERWTTTNLLPDDCIGWARRSVRPLMDHLSAEPVEVLFSTYSPASNHWLALEIKRTTGLPWAADFRDLWTDDYRYRESSPVRRAAHRRMEQEILETADRVIGVTPRQTAILAQHVPDQPEKFVTITNGFDAEDFGRLHGSPRPVGDEFVLTYVGRFDLSYTHEAWFGALRRFVQRLGNDRERFRLRIVGHVNRVAQGKLQATGAICEFHGYLPHRTAITAMGDADALLLNTPTGINGESVICAKIFEYLASRRPILAVGPAGGECERIVLECDAGVVATFDEDSILHGLQTLFEAWQCGCPKTGADPERLQRFSRVELTRSLALTFDRLCERDGRRTGRRLQPVEPCLA